MVYQRQRSSFLRFTRTPGKVLVGDSVEIQEASSFRKKTLILVKRNTHTHTHTHTHMYSLLEHSQLSSVHTETFPLTRLPTICFPLLFILSSLHQKIFDGAAQRSVVHVSVSALAKARLYRSILHTHSPPTRPCSVMHTVKCTSPLVIPSILLITIVQHVLSSIMISFPPYNTLFNLYRFFPRPSTLKTWATLLFKSFLW